MNILRPLIFTLITLFSVTAAQAATYFFHTDHLGTPQVLSDKDQNVVWQGEYSPFGGVTETVGAVEQNLRFPGQYFDVETKLHYNYFREYDSETGRYLTPDPLGVAGLIDALGDDFTGHGVDLDFTGQDTNLYAYVRNNPLLYSDPEGALIQFGPAVAKALRAAVLAFRLYTGTGKAPKPPKPTPPEPTVAAEPIVPPKPPKPPSCP